MTGQQRLAAYQSVVEQVVAAGAWPSTRRQSERDALARLIWEVESMT